MASILLGDGTPIIPPDEPQPPVQVLRSPLRHVWRGWDGTEWDLTGHRPTGVYLRPGVRGMNAAPQQVYRTALAGVNGTRYRGHRLTSREVFWPISIWSAGDSQEWLDYDAKFWRTLQPGRVGTWTVVQPNGTARSLRLRFEDDGDHAAEWDPAQLGWERYGIRFMADQPLWEGATVRPPAWAAADSQNFYGGDAGGGFGPPYFISSSFTLANAVIDNPGDVDAWPVWRITGPTTEVTVGVAGRLIEIPFALTDAQTLVIDTAPTAQTAYLGSTERTQDLGAVNFAPIPAGSSRPLSLAMVGTGTVQAELVPLYLRAHG